MKKQIKLHLSAETILRLAQGGSSGASDPVVGTNAATWCLACTMTCPPNNQV